MPFIFKRSFQKLLRLCVIQLGERVFNHEHVPIDIDCYFNVKLRFVNIYVCIIWLTLFEWK